MLKILIRDEQIFKDKVEEAWKAKRISQRTYEKLHKQFEEKMTI